jgi:GT2 family glycosyltransferase
LAKKGKKPDEAFEPTEQAARAAGEVYASRERSAGTSLSNDLAAKDQFIRDQAQKLAQLQQELEQAQRKDTEAARMIDILERENREILSVLESIHHSVAWKLVKRYRRLKDNLLPPGTFWRRFYDRGLRRLKGSPSASRFRSSTQRSKQGREEVLTAPADDFYHAEVMILSAPAVLGAGNIGTVRVQIRNIGKCKWEAARIRPNWRGSVRLSYNWRNDSWGTVPSEGERTNLPHGLGPQESASIDMRVFAPLEPGTYTLEIALVHEGVAWFNQRGNPGPKTSVRVEPSLERRLVPLCSIVIPVFNRAQFTKVCLLAIEKSVPADQLPYEVIVVDNGSTDETPELLSTWSSSRGNARVISMGHNAGFASACNEGARLARGQYVVLLNNDTLPIPGWLEKMVALAEKEPQVGIVGSKLLFPDGRIQHIGVVFDENKNPKHIYRGFSADIPPARISREYQAVTGACLLVARDLYSSVGGMDETYENSYEDVDLCLKVRARGYRVLVCADSVVYHFESISEGRRASDFRNSALLKARWARDIECDADRWYATDKRNGDEFTELEQPEGYNPRQKSVLRDLWKRVYSCDLSECEFSGGAN